MLFWGGRVVSLKSVCTYGPIPDYESNNFTNVLQFVGHFVCLLRP